MRDDQKKFSTGQRHILKTKGIPQYTFLKHFFRGNAPLSNSLLINVINTYIGSTLGEIPGTKIQSH
jgi:hypothetical protein